MNEALLRWHDFNVGIVTASAALLGLLFVVLALHIRALAGPQNRELRSVARTIFLGYVAAMAIGLLALTPQDLQAFGLEFVVLVVLVAVPFSFAARDGFRASGIGYSRVVTQIQFAAGIALFVVAISTGYLISTGNEAGLFLDGGAAVISLLWGMFNTWELIFRIRLEG